MGNSGDIHFAAWFRLQHGDRPRGNQLELERKVREGAEAQALLAAQKSWDMRQQSALYAWQAREKFT